MSVVQEELDKLLDLEPEILLELMEELTLALGDKIMKGYVYLMKYDTGYYKLGFSKNPSNRKSELARSQQGQEVQVEIVHLIETDNMARLEQETASKFSLRSLLVGNEMWALSQADLDMFCSINSCYYGEKDVRFLPLF